MSEPPILSNPNYPPNENPFAPTYVGTPDRSGGRSHLDIAYWIAVTALFVTSIIIISLVGIWLGWVGVFVSISAAIRVPLLQRSHTQEVSDIIKAPLDLPPPLALLFTSLAWSIVFIVVSFIAFAAICIPGFGIGFFPGYLVLAVSGLSGLLSFCVMFFLSLRLRF